MPLKADDWWDILWFLADRTKKGRVVILLDEISWMGDQDPDFLGKLKAVWDNYYKKNPKLILILCGSVSTWIEKNILSNTGFVGRVSLSLNLKELPLHVCNEFWGRKKQAISAYEKFKLLSVTGGIPRYLEEMLIKLPAEENIKRMCFEPTGILFKEFDQIFPNALTADSVAYRKIVTYLAKRNYAEREELAEISDLVLGGVLSEYLTNLIEASFITRDHSWDIKSGRISTLSHYRLSDNYLRFYLKYIEPNKPRIVKNSFRKNTIRSLPGWDGIMGMQFENLVLNNRENIFKLLNISQSDVVFDNPYFQRKTTRQQSCQIDYLIQTRFNTVYVCEIKFSRFVLTHEIIDEVSEKIACLKLPRYFSYRPVLIHVNGVREDVVDTEYFAEIIDFSQLLSKA